MATPEVLVRVRYYESGSDGRDFYSSSGKDDYMGYIDKGVKSSKTKDYVDYAGSPEKSSGVFNANGLLTSEEKKELRKELRSTKSCIWDCVVSFEEGYGKKNVYDWKRAQDLLNKTLCGFFAGCGMDPKNVTWFAGLHENTDNRHIHLSFFEKEPTHYDRKTKERDFRKGKLSIKGIDLFKASIYKHFLTPVESARRVRKMMVDESVKAVSGNKDCDRGAFNAIIRKLYEEIPMSGELGYESDNMLRCQRDLDEASDLIIVANSYTPAWLKLKKEMTERDEESIEAADRLGFQHRFPLYTIRFNEDLHRRMGNAIIKEVVKKRKEEAEMMKSLHHPKAKNKLHQSFLDSLCKAVSFSMEASYEAWLVFDEFERSLKEAEYKRLVKEGVIDPDGNEAEM
jgi:hypothetical protein